MRLRDTIVHTSYGLFARQGFHNTGVEQLAKAAGTTKRTLYAHFDNKEGLIEAVLNYRHAQFMAALTASVEQQPLACADDVVQAYIQFLTAWAASPEFYGCLFINACAEYSDRAAMPHRIAQMHKQSIRDYLGQQFGKLNSPDPQKYADTLFVIGEGIIVSAQTQQIALEIDFSCL